MNIYNHEGDTLDEEGQEFSDLASARLRAIEGIRSFLGAELLNGEIDLRGRLEIIDDLNVVVETIRFVDAVSIRQP